jgi:hypothetical protein
VAGSGCRWRPAAQALTEKGASVPSKDTPAAEQTGDGAASFGHEAPLSIDIGVAHVARVYDYWLGGKDNFAADWVAGEQAIQAYPDIVYSVRANRAFLARTVRYLAKDAGIRQFLDIGTGIPTANNTHEVAQSVAPGCSVVYVDNDPVVLAHAQALLLSGEQGHTSYIDAGLRPGVAAQRREGGQEPGGPLGRDGAQGPR